MTILLQDLKDFSTVNAVYSQYFPDGHQPARAAFEVKGLPAGGLVEVEAVAVVGSMTAGSIWQCS